MLVFRPLLQMLDVGLLNNAIMPNFGTLIRWRAHSHVLRQSVGWFENDFAGRIANRIMQTPPAAGEAVFQLFDALTYSVAYVIGAVILLSDADAALTLPLLVWLALLRRSGTLDVRRVGPASKAASDARSAVTGRVVDATPTSTRSRCSRIPTESVTTPVRRSKSRGEPFKSRCGSIRAWTYR